MSHPTIANDPKVTEFHKIPCKFVETVPVPFSAAYVSHVPSERFSCDGFLLNRLQASWMLHILHTCPPSYSPHRHPNPKHFSMMCTWTHLPSSSANANSSLQTNTEKGNETNTSNPHNIKQQKKINRHWPCLRKTSTQQKNSFLITYHPSVTVCWWVWVCCGPTSKPWLFTPENRPYTANFSDSAFHWVSPDHSPNPSP